MKYFNEIKFESSSQDSKFSYKNNLFKKIIFDKLVVIFRNI